MGIVLLLELTTLAFIGPSPNERLNPRPPNWVTQGELDLLLFWRSKFPYVLFFNIVLVIALCSFLGETNVFREAYVKVG